MRIGDIRLESYEFGGKWAFRAGGYADEDAAIAAAEAAIGSLGEPDRRNNASGSVVARSAAHNGIIYAWLAGDEGAPLDPDAPLGRPSAQVKWYEAPAGFWCVWGWGFADESAAQIAGGAERGPEVWAAMPDEFLAGTALRR